MERFAEPGMKGYDNEPIAGDDLNDERDPLDLEDSNDGN